MIKELYGSLYSDVRVREKGDRETHILYEDFGDYIYIFEWFNGRKDNSGFKLGIQFLKENNKPIVCSSVNDRTEKTFKRYGFKKFKEHGKRKYYIKVPEGVSHG